MNINDITGIIGNLSGGGGRSGKGDKLSSIIGGIGGLIGGKNKNPFGGGGNFSLFKRYFFVASSVSKHITLVFF